MPRRKHGYWIEECRRAKSWAFYCSECKKTSYYPQNQKDGVKECKYPFCPWCGATMDGGDTDEAD